MKLGIDETTEKNVHYIIDFTRYGEVTIIAQSLKSRRTKLAFYQAAYNYRDGYNTEDVIEIYRLLDEFIEDLKNG